MELGMVTTNQPNKSKPKLVSNTEIRLGLSTPAELVWTLTQQPMQDLAWITIKLKRNNKLAIKNVKKFLTVLQS